MGFSAGTALDIVILGALAATVYYAWRLSGQIDRMQADRRAFESLISALNVAASRAEAAIKSLKDVSLDSGDKLQEKISGARALSEELEIMVQAGDALAERLQTLAEKSRKAAAPSAEREMETAGTGGPRTRAEKDLLEAVKAKQKS